MTLWSAPSPHRIAKKHSNGASKRIRVLVVDDHPAIQEALAVTINRKMEFELCGIAKSAAGALVLAEGTEPDVAVIDISLEDAHGLELVQNLRAQHPRLQVVVFSMYDENVYAERAIRAGASGYVMKSASTQKVTEAIRSVAHGEIYLSQHMTARFLTKLMRGGGKQTTSGLDQLTDREMAVFQMLGQGHGVNEIADRLSLSRKTVETHRRRAKEKLGFDTVAELLQYAIQWMYKNV